MTIRGVVAAIYCLLLALGTWWIVQRNDLVAVDFVAGRDLPLNRWLRPGDVVRADWNFAKGALRIGEPQDSDFVGRYIRGPLPKGAALRLAATDAVPNNVGNPGHFAVLAALSRSGIGELNAESCVRLNVSDEKPFLVRTIFCPATDQADCAAVIDVPAARIGGIGVGVPPLAVAAPATCP